MKVQKQGNKVISLCDFVHKNTEEQKKESQKSIPWGKKSGSSRGIGLSTLLHFNHNDSLSSIRSKQPDYNTSNMQASHFQTILGDARKQIQELRAKRIQMQSDWKIKKMSLSNIKPHYGKDEVEQQSNASVDLDQSEVSEYDGSIYKSVYPRKMYQSTQKEDGFVIQLRRDIVRGKLEQFYGYFQRYGVRVLYMELKCWTRLAIFRANRDLECKRNAFQEWHRVADTQAERLQLREAILLRIKNRKHKQELNVDCQAYINDL